MIDRANLQTADAPLGSAIGQVFDKARHLRSRVAEVLRCCADGYAAAAEYEELSKLSKAELERRGGDACGQSVERKCRLLHLSNVMPAPDRGPG